MNCNKVLFLVFAVLLFILNMLLIRQTFAFSGELFIFEFFLIFFLGIMAVDSINELTKNNASCFSVLAIYFCLILLNSAGLKIASNAGVSLSILLLSGIGFVLSAANINPKKDSSEETFKDVEKEVIEEIVESKEKAEPVKPSYSYVKYLASKTGKKFHLPECVLAKKISKKNRIWLNGKKEAKQKGYKPCKCI